MRTYLSRSLVRRVAWPLVRRAAHRELSRRLPADRIATAIQATWEWYRGVEHALGEPTLGANIMVRLAALTAGLYHTLVAQGVSPDEASQWTSSVTWEVYSVLVAPTWKLTGVGARRPIHRVRRAMDLYMRFPYASPGYEMEYVRTERDCVAFDVHRCPAAEFFRRQGLSDLCATAFCNLDYPLAESWGVTLERSQTIARGASHCDFRFRADGLRADHGEGVRC